VASEVSPSEGLLPEVRLRNAEDDNNQNLVPEQSEIADNSLHFGDYQGTVQEGQIRLVFVNINGFPAKADHPKNSMIKESITRTGASIIGMAETNICWKKLRGKDRWEERSFGWWENMRSLTCHNSHDTPKNNYQPGGNMMMTHGKSKFRIIDSGMDESRLGRWCWQLFSGKRGVQTRVITAYRPCKSRGLTSTYIQQQRILVAKKVELCPRKKMINDLTTQINNWLEAGDQIILMIDLNDNILNSEASRQLQSIGLKEGITQRHDEKQIMSTCNRGNYAIDGIFVSSTIMIQKGGYCPFNIFPSDHRALWIDVTMSNLCGNKMAAVMHPQARRLKCNSPKVQEKWRELYLQALHDKSAVQRAYALQTKLVQPLTEDLINEYEKLRRIRSDARRYADKKCRKLRMGGIPYSPELSLARTKILLWKTIISWKKGRKTNKKYLLRLEKKASLTGSRNTTITNAKTALAQAYAEYWDIKKEANDLRTTFLEKKAKELSKHEKGDEKNIYEQLLLREKQRASARKIKYVLNKVMGSGVTKISLINQDGEWEEVTDKRQIEEGCAQENSSKYRQTETTPCMRGQLVSDLGYLGNTVASQQILDGNYIPPPEANQYTREYLQQLQYHQQAHNDPPVAIIPTTDYISGWKKKNEFTSAGKSGWTFSHSKTCALHKNTAEFEATMAHIPYITGYAPEEWKVGVDIMIYKKANLDRVDKLRTIVLKEADANFNDGRLGREMMIHAENHNMIAREQYGSRKGHSSIDHAINKRLSYDILRLNRAPGALCSNDAKSCYDRILHSIVALSMKRLGLPAPPVECMLECIQKMDHYIRTNHGDSDKAYSSKDTRIPFQGVLQGNGASPSIWVAVSTPLLNMMRQAGHGLDLTTAISQHTSKVVAFAFVDDTDLIQGNLGSTEMTVEEVMHDMQQAIYRWEGGLKTTGGALVPEKSYVYPIDFKFNRAGKVQYKLLQEINSRFEVPNAEGTMTALRQLEASEASETLGVFLAPDGNNSAAKQALTEKALLWSEYIHKGHLSASDVMTAMDTTITPSLHYPLAALTLTEKECTSIMAPILDVALPHSQVCRTFPRAVVYGPKAMMGLGKTDLYLQQGASQIAMLQQYLHTDTITGELLRANIEAIKIHVGIGQNLFSLEYGRFQKLVPPSLIKCIWEFASKYNIEIQEEITANIIPRRENDKFLMEVIANQDNQFSNNDLTHINRCRLYMQVVTLADITNGNGALILEGTLKGTCMQHHKPYYKWPRQSRPSAPSWRIWRKAIKHCFMRNIRMHLVPGMQLGLWTDGLDSDWEWFYVRQTQRIFQRTGNGWKVYRRQGRGRMGSCASFTYLSEAFSKPRQAVRCTVYRDARRQLRIQGSGREGVIRSWNTKTRQSILDQNEIRGEIDDVIQAIQQGTARAVSDGSYVESEGIGAAGWIVEGTREGNQIRGQQETPGSAASQCSHRSEMWGMVGIILTVNAICKEYNITRGAVTAKCDGEGTINCVKYFHPITKNSRKHFDLILALKTAIEVSPIKWQFLHLKGHQDRYISYSQLNRWAQLNVLADTMAKNEVTNILNTGGREGNELPIPYSDCRIFRTGPRGKEPFSSHLKTAIICAIQTNRIQSYWERKKLIGQETSSWVDWEILQKSATTYRKWKWLAKYITGICGVGAMLQVWKYQSHNSCPRCGTAKENAEHIVKCQAPDATNTWNEAVNNLEIWMKDNAAEPNMMEIICSSLRTWRDGTQLPFPRTEVPQIVIEAMIEQDGIGWYNFTNGFISKKWRMIQRAHLKELRSRKSPDLWIARFQRRLWDIAWTLWQHRNEFLHNDGRTIHYQESAAITREIRKEYVMAGNGLPPSYQHLFQGDIEELVNQPIHMKQEWLKSIWVARDHYSSGSLQPRDEIAEAFYLRWKKNITRD
jgi:hypothetical protein